MMKAATAVMNLSPENAVGMAIPSAAGAWAAMSFEEAWQRVLARDASAGGQFVYAVTTTGIVCRPACPSRRPARRNVRFYQSAEDAVAQGYRACLRCQPLGVHADAAVARRLCCYLEEHAGQTVTLKTLGRLAALSSFAVQRLFVRVIGLTPRQYQAGLRAAALRDQLSTAGSTGTITESLYASGYPASSRLYEAAGGLLGMKPARFRDGGAGERIEACVLPCALGFLLVAQTALGVCHIALGDSPGTLEAALRRRFHSADIRMGAEADSLGAVCRQIASLLGEHPCTLDLPLDLRATAFQLRVWNALRAIPRGAARSYRDVAESLGQPGAARAVARACAANPLALVVPCHRVIGSNGSLRGYRWGEDRKRSLLALERAQAEPGQ